MISLTDRLGCALVVCGHILICNVLGALFIRKGLKLFVLCYELRFQLHEGVLNSRAR